MLDECKFVEGRCTACGFVCQLKNVHVPCNASLAMKNAVLANAKKIMASPKKPANRMPRQKGLGDLVAAALSAVGITKERVSKAIGRPCGCGKRQEKLNELGRSLGIG